MERLSDGSMTYGGKQGTPAVRNFAPMDHAKYVTP